MKKVLSTVLIALAIGHAAIPAEVKAQCKDYDGTEQRCFCRVAMNTMIDLRNSHRVQSIEQWEKNKAWLYEWSIQNFSDYAGLGNCQVVIKESPKVINFNYSEKEYERLLKRINKQEEEND